MSGLKLDRNSKSMVDLLWSDGETRAKKKGAKFHEAETEIFPAEKHS